MLDLLPDYFVLVPVFLGLTVLGLWANVALEGRHVKRVHRRARRVPHLERRCRHLAAERDEWRRDALRWQRAYWRAVDHEGDGPHETLQLPTVEDA